MTYILHGCERSGSCIVELALGQIGAEYELRQVNLGSDQQREADYAQRNPQMKLPTLITPEGETLTESVAILLTLEARHPAAGLLPPAGSADHARALRWMLFVGAEIYPIVEINDYPERFTAGGDPAATRELAREIWRRRWRIVEAEIAGAPFLLESGFSMTDAYIAVVSRWAQQEDWCRDKTPKVEAIARAVAARPAFEAIWARHFPAG